MPIAQSGHLSGSRLPVTEMLIALSLSVGFGAFALEPLLNVAADPEASLPALLTPVPREVMLRGTDASGQRTDVMASLHFSESGVHLTQIPRDTFVRSAEHGEHKANAIYLFGGIKAVQTEVSAMLGRPVGHHLIVQLDGLQRIGEALGLSLIHI